MRLAQWANIETKFAKRKKKKIKIKTALSNWIDYLNLNSTNRRTHTHTVLTHEIPRKYRFGCNDIEPRKKKNTKH